MKDRILQIIKEEGMTNTRFANEIGVQPSSISHIVSGRNKASIELISKILHRFPGINTDWLMLGKGEMYKTNSMQTEPSGSRTQPPANDLFSQPAETQSTADEPLDQAEEPATASENTLKSEDPIPYGNSHTKASGKKIEKILVFYSDKTFSEYSPE